VVKVSLSFPDCRAAAKRNNVFFKNIKAVWQVSDQVVDLFLLKTCLKNGVLGKFQPWNSRAGS
jgi:hypothetical protein